MHGCRRYVLILGLLPALAGSARAELSAVNLRCEYRTDPCGLDETRPRLSWELAAASNSRGRWQSAYRILVASAVKDLVPNRADLWDTGRHPAAATNQIVYAGQALQSGQACWWRVRVWDEQGRPGPWSEPARWTMGLLAAADWTAQWIGYDIPPADKTGAELTFAGASWVWSPEGDPRTSAPAGTRYLARVVDLNAAPVSSARMLITVDDQFTAYVNGHEAGSSDGRTDAWRRPRTLDIGAHLAAGRNTIAIEARNTSVSPAGALAVVHVEQADTAPTTLVTDASWQTCTERPPGWPRPDLGRTGWQQAKVLGPAASPPWSLGNAPDGGLVLPPPPYLRTRFRMTKPVARAVLYSAALGLQDLHLNGRPVTADVFSPGWADFRTRCWYRTYEVTDLLRQGDNALGAVLGDGWYAGYVGYNRRRNLYGGEPRLRAQLHITYSDGTTDTVVSDGTWRAAYGPIVEGDLQMGEHYDAREALPGWSLPEFDDASWQTVAVGGPDLPMCAHPGPPVRRQMELTPAAIEPRGKDTWIIDLGQNMVGWVRLEVREAAGRTIGLRFGEMLNPDGSLHTANLRGARATDTYVCRGDPNGETWEPRFTFHGFRYVEITGLSSPPATATVTGIVVHSNMALTGTFSCDIPLLNRLYQNILWGQRGNFIEVPTDCPQRDERLGWTGDILVFLRTGLHNMDVAAFMAKWLVDLNDSQHDNGAYPHVAPDVGAGAGSPAWADAGIFAPYLLHLYYGDTRVLERYYPNMLRYMAFLEQRANRHRQPATGYGDWVSVNSTTPKDVIATAFYALSARCMADIAGVLNRDDDRARFQTLYDDVRKAFVEAYVSGDGKIQGDTQTCYILALAFDLYADSDQATHMAQRLVSDIRQRDTHLTTGFVGTPLLLPTLSAAGHTDAAFDLLLQQSYPSWLYAVRHGATTIWERWNGWTEEHGIHNPGMNSFNHYAFGAVGEWLYRGVGGIDPGAPGLTRLVIAPRVDDRLGPTTVTYHSINGPIAVHWQVADGRLTLTAAVPVNTSARIVIPTPAPAGVREGGHPLDQCPGIGAVHPCERGLAVEVSSGNYVFQADYR